MGAGHPQLFALIDIGRALHAVQQHRKAFCRGDAQRTFITKARDDTRLIVVTPEQRIPRHVVHPALPLRKNRLELNEVRCRQRPFVALGIIHLEMVEVKGHRQLVLRQRSIALAVGQRGRGHFPHRHQSARREHIAVELLQVVMDARAIGVEPPPVMAGQIVAKILVLRHQVDHIKPQSIDASIRPEVAHLL